MIMGLTIDRQISDDGCHNKLLNQYNDALVS